MGKRLFIGIPVSEEVKHRLQPLLSSLRETGADYAAVSLEHLHLTVKFLGEVDEQAIPSVIERLGVTLRPYHSFPASVLGMGVFPHLQHINVVWVGVRAPLLLSLIEDVNQAFATGRSSGREETPHLTVARVKSGKNKRPLQQFVQQWKDNSFGEMVVDRVVLYESRLTPSGPVYVVVKEFLLGERVV